MPNNQNLLLQARIETYVSLRKLIFMANNNIVSVITLNKVMQGYYHMVHAFLGTPLSISDKEMDKLIFTTVEKMKKEPISKLLEIFMDKPIKKGSGQKHA